MSDKPKKIEKQPKISPTQPILSRREFIRDLTVTSGIATSIGMGGWLAYSNEPIRRQPETIHRLRDFRVPATNLHPTLAVVRGNDVERMTREAVTRLGGIERFIKRGDKVLLKPNVGWDRQPEQAANTGPELVAAMVRLCREAGAQAVWVTDHSLNDPARCFFRSGIEAAVTKAGGEIRLPREEDFLRTDMAGTVLKIWPVSRYFHEADKVINLPIVKHHSLCGCTLAMKNWYGVIGGTRNRLHQDIHASIVDLAAAVRPTLTIMDATRVLKRNGPTGGSIADVARGNTLIAGLDEVAIDAFSLQFLDLQPDTVRFLAMGEERGLGRVRWQDLNLSQTQVG
ncbi:MAG: DUF362 domain-containing protein [Magnetococcales bacterium]|nr:DUF362 domain-containing protein [Magnetococcales bacterium]